MFCDRGSSPGVDRADVSTRAKCDFCAGTVFPNQIRIFVVAMLTCVLTQVLGFVHVTTQKCPCVHVLRDSQIVPSLVSSETPEHLLVEEQTLLSALNLSEAGGCNPALQAGRIVGTCSGGGQTRALEKTRRHGQAEVKLRLPPLHTSRRRLRVRNHRAKAVCSRGVLLQGEVPAGLHARTISHGIQTHPYNAARFHQRTVLLPARAMPRFFRTFQPKAADYRWGVGACAPGPS